MVLSIYTKLRILSLHQRGCRISYIAECLVMEDGIVVSKQGIRRFLKRYNDRGTINRKPGSGCTMKLSPMVQQIIENAMQEDDETTATQLQVKLANHGIYISLATILRNRRLLGWIYRGSAYCQLIRTVNKQKRLEWAREYQTDSFDDVILTVPVITACMFEIKYKLNVNSQAISYVSPVVLVFSCQGP